jgi:hypothetical protein
MLMGAGVIVFFGGRLREKQINHILGYLIDNHFLSSHYLLLAG